MSYRDQKLQKGRLSKQEKESRDQPDMKVIMEASEILSRVESSSSSARAYFFLSDLYMLANNPTITSDMSHDVMDIFQAARDDWNENNPSDRVHFNPRNLSDYQWYSIRSRLSDHMFASQYDALSLMKKDMINDRMYDSGLRLSESALVPKDKLPPALQYPVEKYNEPHRMTPFEHYKKTFGDEDYEEKVGMTAERVFEMHTEYVKRHKMKRD
jgi:hypothetical protein